VAQLVVVVEILIAKRNPKHPLADQRHYLVLDQFQAPHVVKAQANRFIILIARSVAPNSSAPASDVTAPASNAATTARPSTGSNPKKSGLHSVGIGALRESTMNCCGTTVFVDPQPRCTQ
jgi:hypothetical protein